MKEQELQKQILDYLRLNKFFAFKVYNQGIYDQARHCYRTIETKGISDIIAIKDGAVLFIECKKPGGVQSEHQKEFQKQIEAKGGVYIIVRSLKIVEEWIDYYESFKRIVI